MRFTCLLLFGIAALGFAAGCGNENASHQFEAERESAPTAARGSHVSAKSAGRDSSAAPGIDGAEASPALPAREPTPPPRTQIAQRKTPARPQFQSGTLTAGSLDDHAGYDEFRAFFSSMLQQSRSGGMPALGIGRRVEIAVVNHEGQPVGNADVTVHPAEEGANQVALAEFPTGTDGKGVFLPGFDGGTNHAAFRVTAKSHDGRHSVTETFEFGQGAWTLKLPATEATLPTRLDVALVVDTTGSMQDELEYLKVEIDGIARAIHRRYPKVDQRFALILYRDYGDSYVTRTFDFTGSLEEFRKSLSRQSANGGGDIPEAVHLSLEQSLKLSWRGGNTARVMFLIGDAPPHLEHERHSLESIRSLRKRGVTVFPVAASGAKKRAEFVFRVAAFLTRGRYLFLTDHSGVGNPHAKPHASKYNVERLDQLMIRMIASQLAGKPLLPRDIIADGQSGGHHGERPGHEQSPMLPPTPAGFHLQSSHDNAWFWSQSMRWAIGLLALIGIVFMERLRK